MVPIDDNSVPPADTSSQPHGDPFVPVSANVPVNEVPGDPFTTATTGAHVPTYFRPPAMPEDLRISWSWPHLLVSVAFFFSSQLAVGIGLLTYYSIDGHLSQNQIKRLIESPKFLVGTTIIWSGLMILFLYVTLAVLRNSPFWSSLGWKKFGAKSAAGKGRPWMYFLAGCGLSLFVAVASSGVKDADHTPIQEIFRSRTGAMLLMAMAVLVAPLFEETLFRGYLYPVLARIISSIAQSGGMESSAALRIGVACSVLLTGGLFGLMHAPQLGWTWGLVGMLILVGVVFTFARAWTGTVVASFLLHLGYNSMLAVSSIIATRGFTHMPVVK